MNYYNEIKNKLINDEIYSKVKDYSKERYKLTTYYEIGRLLEEAGSKYGEYVIDEYSKRLVVEVGRKYNKRTLFRMKQFYNIFSNEKVSTLSTQLSWSHFVELLPLDDLYKIKYYIKITESNNLSVRELRQRIKSNEYERLPQKTKEKLIESKETSVVDYVKNPIIIRNTKDYEEINERALQEMILDKIPSFLEELGEGFTFVKNEYRIKIGDTYNSIDLLLYNIKYKCYIVIELKVTELKKEHIGQIEVYMNYIDKHLKTNDENYTEGIILCRKNKGYYIEYTSNKRVIPIEYIIL